MRHRVIHLINPKTDSLTTRPLYLNRALYSPLAGLLAVAAGIPRDRYEVVLTDENIEPIDFDLKADLVGISAMTSYVNRGYEIADAFLARRVTVPMGGSHMISINDADFFGTPERPKEVTRALKVRGITWQAGVTSTRAQDDRMLELAAASGCTMLSIGFESITRSTLMSVHTHVNRPETFASLVEKVHGYGIMVFGLFMFGFDGDDTTVFKETSRFNIDADYDACAYSVLTPYPGTLTWYELKKAGRIVSYDWERYDQANVVYRPARMTGDQLRLGQTEAYETSYSPSSMSRCFPIRGSRRRIQWAIYNLFMKKGAATDRKDAVAPPTAEPEMVPMPPILPLKREWREAVLEATGSPSRPA